MVIMYTLLINMQLKLSPTFKKNLNDQIIFVLDLYDAKFTLDEFNLHGKVEEKSNY